MIESTSPETLWDHGTGPGNGRLEGDAALWHFTITPLESGHGALQLAVIARTIGADGVLAETQLPEQTIAVKASGDIGSGLKKPAVFVAAMLAGMITIKLAETMFAFDVGFLVRQLLRF